MKRLILCLLMAGINLLPLSAQVSGGEIALLQKLDSVRNSSSTSRFFADIYFSTTEKAVDFYVERTPAEKDFIRRFETRFATFFFRSAAASLLHIEIPFEWKAYYSDSALSPLQYQLLGINAHINGDIWQALTAEFSVKEIEENRAGYFSFQRGLNLQYKEFYAGSFMASSTIRLLHTSTAGLDKWFGKLMLLRWRKRQYDMAVLYFTNNKKFEFKLRKLHHKMEHINRMILLHF